MKRIKIIGLALVAVFAISAVAAASASAEPEFKPKNSAFPVKFSSSSTTNKTKLETEAGRKVECTGLNSSGELTAARKAGSIVVHFTKCKAILGGLTPACKTTGAAAEEIITKTLAAKPVFIEGKTAAKEERGLDVEPATAGGAFAEFECAGTTLVVKNGTAAKNSVIGRIPAAFVGKQSKTAEINFEQLKGVQKPKEYEEPAGTKHEDFLETEGIGGLAPFAREKSAEEAKETITYAGGEEVELS
jgi:hypothetical protein